MPAKRRAKTLQQQDRSSRQTEGISWEKENTAGDKSSPNNYPSLRTCRGQHFGGAHRVTETHVLIATIIADTASFGAEDPRKEAERRDHLARAELGIGASNCC